MFIHTFETEFLIRLKIPEVVSLAHQIAANIMTTYPDDPNNTESAIQNNAYDYLEDFFDPYQAFHAALGQARILRSLVEIMIHSPHSQLAVSVHANLITEALSRFQNWKNEYLKTKGSGFHYRKNYATENFTGLNDKFLDMADGDKNQKGPMKQIGRNIIKCPNCHEITKPTEAIWCADGPPPEKAFRCDSCHITWLKFGTGKSTFIVNPAEKPSDLPMSEWIRNLLAQNQVNQD